MLRKFGQRALKPFFIGVTRLEHLFMFHMRAFHGFFFFRKLDSSSEDFLDWVELFIPMVHVEESSALYFFILDFSLISFELFLTVILVFFVCIWKFVN